MPRIWIISLPSSLARLFFINTTAAPPSVVGQQSRRPTGSATMGAFMTCSARVQAVAEMGLRIQSAVFMGLTRDPCQILFSLLFSYPVLVAIPVEHGCKHPGKVIPFADRDDPFPLQSRSASGDPRPSSFPPPENQRRVTLPTGNSHDRVAKRVIPDCRPP